MPSDEGGIDQPGSEDHWAGEKSRPSATGARFWRLAVFVGGCTLEAVAAVCAEQPDDEAEGLRIVDTLVAHSLIQRRDAAEEPRYLMLETVREYAGELLAASVEEASTRRRHASHYLALAERAEPGLLGPEQQRWFERLGAERENHRAAIEWALEHGEQLAALASASPSGVSGGSAAASIRASPGCAPALTVSWRCRWSGALGSTSRCAQSR